MFISLFELLCPAIGVRLSCSAGPMYVKGECEIRLQLQLHPHYRPHWSLVINPFFLPGHSVAHGECMWYALYCVVYTIFGAFSLGTHGRWLSLNIHLIWLAVRSGSPLFLKTCCLLLFASCLLRRRFWLCCPPLFPLVKESVFRASPTLGLGTTAFHAQRFLRKWYVSQYVQFNDF